MRKSIKCKKTINRLVVRHLWVVGLGKQVVRLEETKRCGVLSAGTPMRCGQAEPCNATGWKLGYSR